MLVFYEQWGKNRTAVLYLPTWHKFPLYPGAHWQSKSFPALTHVPPFLHGLGSHTESVMGKNKINRKCWRGQEISCAIMLLYWGGQFKKHFRLNINLMSPATLDILNNRKMSFDIKLCFSILFQFKFFASFCLHNFLFLLRGTWFMFKCGLQKMHRTSTIVSLYANCKIDWRTVKHNLGQVLLLFLLNYSMSLFVWMTDLKAIQGKARLFLAVVSLSSIHSCKYASRWY